MSTLVLLQAGSFKTNRGTIRTWRHGILSSKAFLASCRNTRFRPIGSSQRLECVSLQGGRIMADVVLVDTVCPLKGSQLWKPRPKALDCPLLLSLTKRLERVQIHLCASRVGARARFVTRQQLRSLHSRTF